MIYLIIFTCICIAVYIACKIAKRRGYTPLCLMPSGVLIPGGGHKNIIILTLFTFFVVWFSKMVYEDGWAYAWEQFLILISEDPKAWPFCLYL